MKKITFLLTFILQSIIIYMVIGFVITKSSKIHADYNATEPTNIPSFEDMFKGVDWEALAKQIEKEFEEFNATSEGFPKPQQPTQPPAQQQPMPTSPLIVPPSPTPSQALDKKIPLQTTRKLFEDGIVKDPTDKSTSKNQSITIPAQYKYAYHSIISSMLSDFSFLEQYVLTSNQFSPDYKKEFLHYQQYLDTLFSEYELIGSLDPYLFIFFGENKKTLRLKILEAFNFVTNLAKRLPQIDEEFEHIITQQELQQRAQQPNNIKSAEQQEEKRRTSERKK